jgi:hypothetical protein
MMVPVRSEVGHAAAADGEDLEHVASLSMTTPVPLAATPPPAATRLAGRRA